MAKEARKTTEKPARKPALRRRRTATVSKEQIAERAYYFYVDGTEGDALEHWVRAERELTAA